MAACRATIISTFFIGLEGLTVVALKETEAQRSEARDLKPYCSQAAKLVAYRSSYTSWGLCRG